MSLSTCILLKIIIIYILLVDNNKYISLAILSYL